MHKGVEKQRLFLTTVLVGQQCVSVSVVGPGGLLFEWLVSWLVGWYRFQGVVVWCRVHARYVRCLSV